MIHLANRAMIVLTYDDDAMKPRLLFPLLFVVVTVVAPSFFWSIFFIITYLINCKCVGKQGVVFISLLSHDDDWRMCSLVSRLV